jgi:hypothetical protein
MYNKKLLFFADTKNSIFRKFLNNFLDKQVRTLKHYKKIAKHYVFWCNKIIPCLKGGRKLKF